MEDEPIIQTKELTKAYGPHVALDNLNLSIPRGATGLLNKMVPENPRFSKPSSA